MIVMVAIEHICSVRIVCDDDYFWTEAGKRLHQSFDVASALCIGIHAKYTLSFLYVYDEYISTFVYALKLVRAELHLESSRLERQSYARVTFEIVGNLDMIWICRGSQ